MSILRKKLFLLIAAVFTVSAVFSSALPGFAEELIKDKEITLTYGETVTLTKTSDNITFYSSDKRVACVDKNGTVKSMGRGVCTIIAVDNETHTAEGCTVTVKVSWWRIFSNLIWFIKNLRCEVCRQDPGIPPETEIPVTTRTPGTTSKKPVDPTEKTDIPTDKPDEPTQRPDDSTSQPDDTTQQPDSTTETPGGSTEKPADSTKPVEPTSETETGDDGPVIHPTGTSQDEPSSGEPATDDSTSASESTTQVIPESNPVKEREYLISFGGTQDDRIIAADSSGKTVFACGQSSSSDGDFEGLLPETPYSSPFGFVCALNESGERIWTSFITDENMTVCPTGIAVLRKGNIAVSGYLTGRDYQTDAFVAVFDSDGTQTAMHILSGAGYDVLNCIAATSDGYVTGGKTSSTDGDFEGLPDYGHNISILIRFDKDGNVIWKRYLGGSGVSGVEDVDTDGDNNVFVSVSTLSNDGEFSSFKGLLKGSLDNVILKYDAYGSLVWNSVLSTNGRDNFNCVVSDGNGGCLAGGYYQLSGSSVTLGTLKGTVFLGGTDALIVKIDPDGAVRWQSNINGGGNDFINDLMKIKNGYAVCGYSNSSNGRFSTNYGDYDGFCAVFSSTGKMISMINLGGSDADNAHALAYPDSSLAILGYSVSDNGYFDGQNRYADMYSSGNGLDYALYDSFAARYRLEM